MSKNIIKKGDRYDLICGRFGIYIYDKLKQEEVDMIQIWELLNEWYITEQYRAEKEAEQ